MYKYLLITPLDFPNAGILRPFNTQQNNGKLYVQYRSGFFRRAVCCTQFYLRLSACDFSFVAECVPS